MKKHTFKKELDFCDYFDKIMRNKGECRELFVKVLNKMTKIHFVPNYELSEIGFYLFNEDRSREFICEYVGSEMKLVLHNHNNYNETKFTFKQINQTFSVKKMINFIKEII